jgi:hypothetical protein
MLVRDRFRRPFSTPPMKLGVSPATSAKASRVQPSAMRRCLTSRPKATTRSSVATVAPLVGVAVAPLAAIASQRQEGNDVGRVEILQATFKALEAGTELADLHVAGRFDLR